MIPAARSNFGSQGSGIGKPVPRFDGAEAWARLAPEDQAEIGALALEIVACGTVIAYADRAEAAGGAVDQRVVRAADMGASTLLDELDDAVHDAGAVTASAVFAVPLRLGRVCRGCGCSEQDACNMGCSWVEESGDGLDGLCSACRGAAP